MITLATRTLHYVDEDGLVKEVTMRLVDFVDEEGTRQIGLRFGAPFTWAVTLCAENVLDAIIYVMSAWWVRLFVGKMPLANNIRWRDAHGRESFNCGLPALRKRPDTWAAPDIPLAEQNPGDLNVLSESTVPFPDPSGIEQGRRLIVFTPTQAASDQWKCGFAFDSEHAGAVRYGVGDDWIQSLLDAAAMARVVYESMLPQGWKPRDGAGLERLPYKMGRGYFIDEQA